MKLPQTLQEEIKNVLAGSPKESIHHILESARTKEIMEALPAHDTYFLIKESWGEDSQILLQYMPPEKVCNLIDIDCWNKDVLSLEGLIEWLKELMEASASTFINTMNTLDIELIVLMFQSFIEVHQISPTDENAVVLIESGFETFDSLYYFRFLDDREENHIIRIFLDTIFTHNQELYHLIMQGISWEISSSLEEEAFHQRVLRLIEMGFPPPTDSLSIYRHIKPENLIAQGTHDSKVPDIEKTPYFPALYKDHFSKGKDLITTALGQADRQTQQRIQWEMVYLTNKVIMSDYAPLSDLEGIGLSIEKAKGFISLSLGFLEREKEIPLTSILDNFDAETLFCLGYNLVTAQQKRLKNIILRTGTTIIPEKERAILDDILKKKPLYQGKNFSSIEDLDSVTHEIDRIEAMSLLLSHLEWENFLKKLLHTNIQSPHGLDMENIILTAAAINSIEKKIYFRPITIQEALKFIERIIRKDAHGNREITPDFHNSLCFLLTNTEPSIKSPLIQQVAENIEKRLIDELSGIKNIRSIDPRFITCLVIKIQNET